MAKREFLMLAHKWVPEKHDVRGWFMSEKLDGMRCFWDGGVTRGLLKSDVPWANTDKDERYNDVQMCTGLWSRYGNVIHAPISWLNGLPGIPLDGELWIPDHRQELMSIVKQVLDPCAADWDRVQYWIFESPNTDTIFANGEINTTNFKKKLVDVESWFRSRGGVSLKKRDFEEKYDFFYRHRDEWYEKSEGKVVVLEQKRVRDVIHVNSMLEDITDAGGEGVVLRNPISIWCPQRSYSLLKVKKLDDAEGVVVGYTSGRETDKGSKLLGMMGALIIKLENGRELELSGFTESERAFDNFDMRQIAIANPGERMPEWFDSPLFPVGSKVTFRYRGLTRDGIPQEARYWRVRNDG